ncbi:hypothetical protein PSHT_14264 [Puccinia striiformis]|uniref:Uncharacterized protein n=1 Tax=Puccinia striiformis TaxID=27350 RepID=A0A2S4UL24_9BASI|nr:hypothetical protein PSHT_14264 [Puccinia striiformis]
MDSRTLPSQTSTQLDRRVHQSHSNSRPYGVDRFIRFASLLRWSDTPSANQSTEAGSYTGDYPTQITVVGHSVKSKRFNELHRKAMRWPQERFEYIGLDPINLNRFTTTSTSFSSQETIDLKEIESSMILGEKKVYLEFERDLYGCNLSLMEKRKKRNGFRRFHPYLTSNPEIRGLLNWCPINGIDEYTGSLPWA